ncbi:MAG: alpha/beta hydrolase, partial [Chlamydiae bacterium]|nr:alpha/beta hydrolase [Chlamydiota bacterium]
WLQKQPATKNCQIGLFGASTGAAAALDAAASLQDSIRAIVSRGGRPDLAQHLAQVKAPTLLLVGENDEEVLKLNENAFMQLSCIKELKIIPHATHLFEEKGCLEEVALLAKKWFLSYLG